MSSKRKKNKHVNVNGRLLNMGKGWKDLKVKQREFIANSLVSNIESALNDNEFKGVKSIKKEVYQATWENIVEREIWIPEYEFKMYFGKAFSKYIRKHHPDVNNPS